MKIDSYSFGSMYIEGKKYSSDLIIYPDGKIKSKWWRKQGHILTIEDVGIKGDKNLDVVVIGTGVDGLMNVKADTVEYLKTVCKSLIIEKTAEAVKQFNTFSQQGRIMGLFHLTC